MISLHFGISNPWHKENFANLWCADGSITKNKHWEFQIIRHAYDLLELHASYTIRQDHAGLKLVVGLFGYSIHFDLYDSRHWNCETNTWETYE